MTIPEFIKKAIEGGWEGKSTAIHKMVLDPLAWQAVGKVEGWELYSCSDCYQSDEGFTFDECPKCLGERGRVEMVTWLVNMHRMIDALAEGKTIEEFIATL